MDKHKKPKIAFVNDDPFQLKMAAAILRKDNLDVSTFENVQEAFKGMGQDNLPDLIITDLHMPGIDGWRFCRLLRSREYAQFNKIPVMVMSATFSGVDAAQVTADLGANAFLPVPYKPVVLLSHIRSLLNGEKPELLPKVLIVDDLLYLAKHMKKVFEQNGYDTQVAGSGEEARKQFTKHQPDIVILDYYLPDTQGDELLAEFKKIKPRTIAIMITSDESAKLTLDFVAKGADGYVRKPFDVAYLIDLCQKIQRERSFLHIEELLESRTIELRKSEEKFRCVLENSVTTIYKLDLKTRTYEYLSPSVEQIYGYTPEEIIAEGLKVTISRIHPEDTKKLKKHLQYLLSGQIEYFSPTIEYRFLHPKLGYRWIRDTRTVIFDENDNPLSIIGNSYDITKHKKMMESLAQSKNQLLSIFDGIDEAVYVADPETYELLYINNVVRASWGDPGSKKCHEYLQKRNSPCPFCTNDKIFDKLGESLVWEFQNELNKRWYRCIDKAIAWPDGRMVRYEMAIDISDQKLAKEEKATLEAQLYQAMKMESVGRLAGGVAHDFNNLLTGITGNIQLAQMDLAKNDPLYETLDEVNHAANRAAELTHQLLSFSRKQMIKPKVINLNELIENMQKMLVRIIGEDISLRSIPMKHLGQVKADTGLVEQIIVNLAVNARDAMPKGGKLTIETKDVTLDKEYCKKHVHIKPGNYIMLAISDNGEGMDWETQEKIFEPFYTTKEKGKGTGLGLSTVYGIVKQHNGYIELYSEIDEGTIFKIYFPEIKEKAEPIVQKTITNNLERGSETVFIVEDESIVRDIAVRILKRLGYNVIPANDGSNAITIAKRENIDIDLLLTDVVMPNMNGRELAEKLLKIYPKMKVLFTSGYTENVIAHHGMLDEGLEFIGKPYSPQALANKVRKVLDM